MKAALIALLLVIADIGLRPAEADSTVLMKRCRRAKAEVMFVLDSSTTVGPDNWKLQLSFLNHLLEPFTIGPRRTRVGVITFNNKVRYPIALKKGYSKQQLQARIRALEYSEGATFTGEALSKAGEVLRSGRRTASKIIILLTDGRSNGFYNAVEEAKRLRRNKILILTVGITDAINKKELNEISTSGHFEQVKDFKHLQGVLVKKIQRKSCRAVIVKVCKKRKADLTFILDSSTSIGPAHWRQTLAFVERLVDPLFVGENAGHVALMTYNTKPHLQFLYKKFLNKVVLLKKGIRTVTYTEGLTFTGEALEFFRKKLYPKMRDEVAKVVVLITDGHANGQIDQLKEAQELKKMGVEFITVGVTNEIDKKVLKIISSTHIVHSATDFSGLRKIIAKVQGEECRDINKVVID